MFRCLIKRKIPLINLKDNNLGTFTVSANDCTVINDLDKYDLSDPKFIPKFYNLTKDGFSKGKILANFVLVKNPKTHSLSKYEDSSRSKLKKMIKKHITTFKSDVDFSAFGLRNLAAPLKNPRVTVTLSQKNKEDKTSFCDRGCSVIIDNSKHQLSS